MADVLADYWRAKHDALANQPAQALIRSLRGQLVTIKRIAQQGGGEEPAEVLRQISVHAGIALALELPAAVEAVDGTLARSNEDSLFVSERRGE